jgi:hypothetical protein
MYLFTIILAVIVALSVIAEAVVEESSLLHQLSEVCINICECSCNYSGKHSLYILLCIE